MFDLARIATHVAIALGGNYRPIATADDDPCHATIGNQDFGDQFGIRLHHDARDKKIRIGGRYPWSKDGNTFPFGSRPDISINVGESRESSAIAREIERRFLATYKEVFARGKRDRDLHEQYNDALKRNLAEFAELLGGKVRGETVDVPMGNGDKYGYIRTFMAGADNVQFDMRSVPVPVAKRMLKAWKDDDK